MSLEDIDDKFEDVAKSFSSKKKKKDEPASESTDSETETYENSVTEKKLSPLLAIFEDHLRKQRSSEKKKNQESDEEFSTINIEELKVIPSVEDGEPRAAEVTEEEIESLLNFSKPKVSDIKKETTVSDVVYSQKRYEDAHPAPINIANPDDLNIKYEINSAAAGPEVNTAADEDTVVGLKPVNVSEKYKKTNPPETSPTPVEPVVTNDANDNVPADVIEHIKNHKKRKKSMSETDKTGETE